jgi:hypothetical protein
VRPEGYRFYGRVPTVDDRDLEGALEREGERFLGLVRERDFLALPAAVQARFRVLGADDVGSRRVLVLGAPAAAAD